MAILLPLLALPLFAGLYQVRQATARRRLGGPQGSTGPLEDWRDIWLNTIVTWGLFVTAITELLSLFQALDYASLVGAWFGLDVVLCLLLWRVRRRVETFRIRWPWVTQAPHLSNDGGMNRQSRFMAVAIGLIVVVTLVIAVQAAPNNGDAMTYVMPRIRHWLQYRAVTHYPTHYTLQLFSEPWAEYVLVQWQILIGSDRLSNLLQWASMVSSLIGVSMIARQLGANTTVQWLSALLAATLPTGIMHATTPRNLYVVAFWLVCFVVYTLKIVTDRPRRSALLGATCSLSLAVLSKGTAYVYALPFILWLVWVYWRRLRWRTFKYLLMTWPIFALVNLGHYIRNWQTFGSPISTYPYKLSNDVFTLPSFVSGVVKNVALHLTWPVFDPGWVKQIVVQVHAWLSLSPIDPRLNFYGVADIYQPVSFELNMLPLAEDRTTNPLHFWLWMGMTVLLLLWACRRRLSSRLSATLIVYTGVTLGAFLLFCLLIKWQVWHGRLHLPVFLMACPVIAIGLAQLCRPKQWQWVVLLLWLASWPYLMLNETRPLIGGGSIFTQPRLSQYFAGRADAQFEQSYYDVTQQIDQRQCTSIGLIAQPNSYEYPLWQSLDRGLKQPYQLHHVNVENPSAQRIPRSAFALPSPITPTDHPGCVVLMGQPSQAMLRVNQKRYERVWSGPPVAGELHLFAPLDDR